ncbi:hypothetical protein D3C86_2117400 [compost metagenome]
MLSGVVPGILAHLVIGFRHQQFFYRISTIDMRQQLRRDQAVGEGIVNLVREIDLDAG